MKRSHTGNFLLALRLSKPSLFVLCIFTFGTVTEHFSAVAYAVDTALPTATKDAVAPLFEADLLSSAADAGQRIALAKQRGKVVYLDFWAAWCVPCAKTLPWMQRMHERYASKGLVILAINQDSDDKKPLQMLKNINASFLALKDPQGTIASLYAPESMPSSFLMDRTGKIREIFKGFKSGDEDILESKILALLAEQLPR